MSRPASAVPSPSTRISATTQRGLRVLLLLAGAILLGQTLAGYFFLWSIGRSVRDVTPLTTVLYLYYYGDRPEVRSRVFACSVIAFSAMAATAVAAIWPRPRPLHGEARFARRHEIARAGLLGNEGIVLGEIGRHYIIMPGQQGVALAAPPRSGKGVGVVVPNLLNWPGSVVCVDVKRENWTITAGYRAAMGQECYLFDPLAEDGRTARWNPNFYVAPQRNRWINDIQRIATMFYPEVQGADPFWMASARSLFLGISLYLFETPSLLKTIGEVLRQGMASDDEGFGHHWKRIIEGRNSGRFPLSQQCVRALYDVIDLAPVTASSIRKTFTSRLDLWLNPILDAATSASDFDLRDLRRRPMSIYVAVNPDDLHRLRPVLSLFFEQAIGLQTRVLPEHDPTLKYPVMILLDEVAALGRIPILSESIAYVPGYNVRVVMVFQTPSQLREVYGVENAKTIMKSLGARIVYAPKDFDDAKEISDELGFTTVRVRTRSRPEFGALGLKATRNANVTMSEQKRALLLPQEVKELGSNKEIIFCEGMRPIMANKIKYFSDPRFLGRLLPAPNDPSPSGASAALPEVGPELTKSPTPDTAASSLRTGAVHSGSEADGVRPAALDDIERLDSLTLDDFAADFSRVELPSHDGPWSEQEMQTAVQSFLTTLECRPSAP
jgi:type IV secretion system protein VirD4